MIKLDFSKFDLSTKEGLYAASIYCVDETYKYTFTEGWYTLFGNDVGFLIREGYDTSKHYGLMLKDYSSEKKNKFRAAYDAYNEKLDQHCKEEQDWEDLRDSRPHKTKEEKLERAKARFEFEKKFALKEAELFDEFYAEIDSIIKESDK